MPAVCSQRVEAHYNMLFGSLGGSMLGAGCWYSRGGGGAAELDGSEPGVCGGDGAVGGCRKRPHSVMENILFNESPS